jgi:uncharacterized protein YndB with AHSA1/START domain
MTTTPDQQGVIRRATIEAEPNQPLVRIVRDFDAAPEKVFRAWTEKALVERWLGPKDTPMRIHAWEPRTGGHYRYDALRDGEVIASFYGSFHEVRPPERLVQTFTFEGVPDGVSLDIISFEDLGGRTRVTSVSVLESVEGRDMMMASGMEVGIHEGFEALDALLAEL